jgi:CDP-6-deoxy-D-xylo-4-hexulose-3-dehydrase
MNRIPIGDFPLGPEEKAAIQRVTDSGRIPIGDFPLGPEEKAAIQRVTDSGRITMGREVRAFEEEFAAYMGVRHCVAVSSGTAALMVGLRALGVSKQFPFTIGARVLVPALTFIATANAVELSGFRIMFGDIEPETMCLDPAEIAKTRTEMVLPVHLMGYGADMKRIVEECTKHQRVLVGDAAEAHGTTIDGKLAGTFGAWGAFSFYIAHTVQAGELGCIATNSTEIAEISRQLRAHGRSCKCLKCTRSTTGCPHLGDDLDPRFRFEYVGWNFKPMEFQAALARAQLGRIEENIWKRRENRSSLFVGVNGLMASGAIEPIKTFSTNVPMAFPIILKRKGYRDRVVAELERRGVEARPLFGCIPTQQPAYAGTEDAPRMKAIYQNRLPVAEHYGADGFYVGCHQYLTAEQVDRMASIIRDVIAEVVT